MNIAPFPDDTPLMGDGTPKAEQVFDLIRYLVTVWHRFGNTAVRYSIQWGAAALHASDDQKRRIAQLEQALRESVDVFERVPVDLAISEDVRRQLRTNRIVIGHGEVWVSKNGNGSNFPVAWLAEGKTLADLDAAGYRPETPSETKERLGIEAS